MPETCFFGVGLPDPPAGVFKRVLRRRIPCPTYDISRRGREATAYTDDGDAQTMRCTQGRLSREMGFKGWMEAQGLPAYGTADL